MKLTFYILMTTALAAAIYNRKSLPKRVGIFIPLIALGIGLQLLAQYWPGEKSGALSIIHVYQMLAFPLLAFYFYQTIHHRILKWAFPISMVPFYISVVLYYLNFPGDWEEAFFPEQSLISLMVVVGSLVVFYEMYMAEEMAELKRSPDFWLGTANLIYYAGYLLSLGAYRYVDKVIEDHELASTLLYITHWLNLLLYSIYTIGFLCNRKTTPS